MEVDAARAGHGVGVMLCECPDAAGFHNFIKRLSKKQDAVWGRAGAVRSADAPEDMCEISSYGLAEGWV